MIPPQSGHCHRERMGNADEVASAAGRSDDWSNREQSGRNSARRRLARKPKLRVRIRAARQQVKEETAQELIDGQGHEPFLVAVGGVAPAKGYVALGESYQPAVGDDDAMSVNT